MSLVPEAEQISAQNVPGALAAASAWDTDGANAATRIARHAIKAVKYLVNRLAAMARV